MEEDMGISGAAGTVKREQEFVDLPGGKECAPVGNQRDPARGRRGNDLVLHAQREDASLTSRIEQVRRSEPPWHCLAPIRHRYAII